jgi:hypothetical protein
MGVLKPVWGIGGELASLRTIDPGRTMEVSFGEKDFCLIFSSSSVIDHVTGIPPRNGRETAWPVLT